MSGTLPWDSAGLLPSAARVLITPIATTLPVKPSDVFVQEDPYTAAASWRDIGATASPFQYGRNVTVQDYTIEQSQGPVISNVQEVQRTAQVAIANVTKENMQLIEDGGTPGAITAVAGSSAYDTAPFGNIPSLTHYRLAAVAERDPISGLVTESGGTTRGRFFIVVLYDVTIDAENVTAQLGKNQLFSCSLTLKAYPVDTQPQREEFGTFWDETAGTIA